jgi:hypothetical protein
MHLSHYMLLVITGFAVALAKYANAEECTKDTANVVLSIPGNPSPSPFSRDGEYGERCIEPQSATRQVCVPSGRTLRQYEVIDRAKQNVRNGGTGGYGRTTGLRTTRLELIA